MREAIAVCAREETSAALACPHCGAGLETVVVGLAWDRDEQSWRCFICGHRTFPQPRRSAAQIREDLLWEQLVESADEEPSQKEEHTQQEEWEEEATEGTVASSSSGYQSLRNDGLRVVVIVASH
jgi:transcription elongation factor Elf1